MSEFDDPAFADKLGKTLRGTRRRASTAPGFLQGSLFQLSWPQIGVVFGLATLFLTLVIGYARAGCNQGSAAYKRSAALGGSMVGLLAIYVALLVAAKLWK